MTPKITWLDMLSNHLGLTTAETEQRLVEFYGILTRATCLECCRDIARRTDDLVRYHRTVQGDPCQASGTYLPPVAPETIKNWVRTDWPGTLPVVKKADCESSR